MGSQDTRWEEETPLDFLVLFFKTDKWVPRKNFGAILAYIMSYVHKILNYTEAQNGKEERIKRNKIDPYHEKKKGVGLTPMALHYPLLKQKGEKVRERKMLISE